MWIEVIWEMLPCDHCTASPDLLLSMERAGLLLLPDTLTGSSASHFCFCLSFLVAIQSETHIITLRKPYRHVLCSPSCSGRDGDALPAVLWKFLLEWPENQFVAHYPQGCCLHVKYNWDTYTKIKAIMSYAPRCKHSLNCEGLFFHLQPAPGAYSSEWERGRGNSSFLSGSSLLGCYRWPSSQIQPSGLYCKQAFLVALRLAFAPLKSLQETPYEMEKCMIRWVGFPPASPSSELLPLPSGKWSYSKANGSSRHFVLNSYLHNVLLGAYEGIRLHPRQEEVFQYSGMTWWLLPSLADEHHG